MAITLFDKKEVWFLVFYYFKNANAKIAFMCMFVLTTLLGVGWLYTKTFCSIIQKSEFYKKIFSL